MAAKKSVAAGKRLFTPSVKWAKGKKDGTVVDALYALAERRRAAARAVDDLKAIERELSELLAERLDGQKLSQIRGSAASFTVSSEVVAQVEDWEKFFDSVAKEDAFDVMQKRVSNKVYRDLLEDGVKLEGVSPISIQKTSCRKVAAKK